jgi:hypothetical protein
VRNLSHSAPSILRKHHQTLGSNIARRPRPQTEAEWIIQWIEEHCLRSNGTPAVLTFAQKETIRRIYDDPNDGSELDEIGVVLEPELKTYLALCHLCGIRAGHQEPVPAGLQGVDLFSMWGATGPSLKLVLERRSGAIVCPGTGYAISRHRGLK